MGNKYKTLKGRLKHYFPMKILAIALIFSSGITIAVFIISKSAFFLIPTVLFVVAFFANFAVYKKRGRFYIADYKTDTSGIEIIFYDNDTPKKLISSWETFNYYYGAVKGDNYLVIWYNDTEILKFYKSFGTHKLTFANLSDSFQKHIAPERIKRTTSLNFFNQFPLTYTKSYDGFFKMV